ncbi:hypothetical protein AB4Z43_02215 [Mesorhizobium sp. 2RAF45]|uniref:hypothetical protein n=1 Tax=Mesorhizobium sp. 2RAF45 TaxID=3233001 RepID=UPI003F954B51
MAKPTITIPSLVEVDSEIKDLVNREASLNNRLSEIRREITDVETAIADERTTAGPRLRSAVAQLTGDADAAAVDRRKELQTLRHAESDHLEALAVIQRRVHERRGTASRAVIAAVQSEIDKRVGAVAAATNAALSAQIDLEAFIRDLEAESVESDALRSGVTPFFLTSGAAERYVAEHGNAV